MDKIIACSQLAMKAHKVVMGDRLIPAIRAGSVYVVIVSSDVGKNRLKKLKNKCTYYHIPWVKMDELEFNKISNRTIRSFGITDKNFADQIIKKGQVIADGIQIKTTAQEKTKQAQ